MEARGIFMTFQDQKLKKLIEDTVERSINDFFRDKEVTVTHVLDRIFPNERRIRSLIGGLETSFGTSVWEPLAKSFAKENGFQVHDEKSFNKKVPVIPDKLRHYISDFENLKKKNADIEINNFVKNVKDLIKENKLNIGYATQKMPKGEGVDLWLSKNGTNYLIDIKTNQINAGGGPKFLTNQLNWICYQLLQDIDSDVVAILAFPFNPHDVDFWKKEKGKVAPLIPGKEAMVGDEFWDLILGRDNTSQFILDSFTALGKKNFSERFKNIFYVNNG